VANRTYSVAQVARIIRVYNQLEGVAELHVSINAARRVIKELERRDAACRDALSKEASEQCMLENADC
jgi:hypothetical protein